ncbi:hypothetical protein SAV14893_052170 [Streptomyces avermitilis]|uniref:Uncharacterized protein n=1 Tax=Streptomyces avermitilis TaxID=33903 RepID=A0A4D4M1Z0_STRAX|nr:hypothetical protein SAV14893_052170 [Streptomyces avermitilis]
MRTQPQVRVVQREQPDVGVAELLELAARAHHLVPLPGLPELRGLAAQPLEQHLPGGLGEMVGHGGAELGGHEPHRVVQSDDGRLPVRVRVAQQHAVAVHRRDGVEVAQQQPVGPVVGEDVVPAVLDARRNRLQLFQQGTLGVGDRRAVRAGLGVGRAGQVEQVGALAGVEEQGAGQRVEHLHRDLDVPGLFQPGVPGDADRGELRDLLPAQTRGAPPTAPGRPTCSG